MILFLTTAINSSNSHKKLIDEFKTIQKGRKKEETHQPSTSQETARN